MTSYVPGAGPTAVFISQVGTEGSTWQPVVDRLVSGVSTFTYDRPGTGTCPLRPDPERPVPYSVLADELADLLDQYGVARPVILVGHSVGSLIARVFAGRYPQQVAGVVHVDGSIPRLALWPGDGDGRDGDGPDATRFDVVAGEVEVLRATVAAVPTIVVCRTAGRWDVPPPHPAIDDLWTVHQELLAHSVGVPLWRARNAGHQLPTEDPALVARAVDTVAFDAAELG